MDKVSEHQQQYIRNPSQTNESNPLLNKYHKPNKQTKNPNIETLNHRKKGKLQFTTLNYDPFFNVSLNFRDTRFTLQLDSIARSLPPPSKLPLEPTEK